MNFGSLPLAARAYILAVILLAVILAGVSLAAWWSIGHPLDESWKFVPLLCASLIVHTVKIELTGAASTFSIGYAVSFAALLLLGTNGAIWIVMAGAWAQCTLRMKVQNPWYQTAFSVSVLALSMAAAGLVLSLTHGPTVSGPADVVIPSMMVSSPAYFLPNSLLMATVIALTTARTPMQVWDHALLWGAPTYFIGALVATVAVQSAGRFGLPSVIILAALGFLTLRIYIVYRRRVDEAMTDPLTRL